MVRLIAVRKLKGDTLAREMVFGIDILKLFINSTDTLKSYCPSNRDECLRPIEEKCIFRLKFYCKNRLCQNCYDSVSKCQLNYSALQT